jgi:competence protein ComEC
MMLRPRALLGLFATFVFAFTLSGQAPAAGKLRIYFIDVEGGQSTLFVTPAGKSLLIDTGWPDNNFRDADRIVAAAKSAGLSRIDAVLITHFHEDHVGGVPQLVQRIPVGTFFVHGPNRELDHGATGKAPTRARTASRPTEAAVLQATTRHLTSCRTSASAACTA